MIRPANAARIAAEITARTEWVTGKLPRAWQGNLYVWLTTRTLDEAIDRARGGHSALGMEWAQNAYKLARAMDVCTTCHGTCEIQTTEWPALFDVCPDCYSK